MGIWGALGFMTLGGAIVEIYNLRAWKMYQAGKREMNDYWRGRK